MLQDRSVIALERANELLADYAAGAPFFFASPSRTLLAEGAAAVVEQPASDPAALLVAVGSALAAADAAGVEAPLAVGAVPFCADAPARLLVPAAVRRAGRLNFAALESSEAAGPSCAIEPLPHPAEYAASVEAALARFAAGDLRKVVLSRALQLTAPAEIDLAGLVRRLAGRNQQGYTFAVDLPGAGRRTLVGASPELLVSRTGRHVTAHPLAGSAPRAEDPAEDRRRAMALLVSAKDLHEHALVAEAVADGLRPYCRSVKAPAVPSLVQTATMWHLASRITGELDERRASSLELALALHPTPAVCGYPTALARAAIGELEGFDRGFFTGMVGWCDGRGDGEWAVTIRCAEVEGRRLRLYAGAGIVPGSSPEAEVAETAAKFGTLLNAMGLNQRAAGA
ncbi:MAG TPA: isochorismate synthase DhbC [Herpetosiphonaceae bacterium]